MKLFTRSRADRFPEPQPERRASQRTRVKAQATLLMPSGNRAGHIFDISTDGARFMCDNPPPKGISAILEWPSYEVFCVVTWEKPGMCGVVFDRAIPQAAVDRLAAIAPAGPRSLASLPDDPDEDPIAPPRERLRPPAPLPRRFC